MASDIDPKLLEILVCPETKAPLIQIGDWLYSTDAATRRRYAIRDGIPILLAEESETVSQHEFDRVMSEHHRQPDSAQKTREI